MTTDIEKIKNWIRSKDPVLQITQCKDILGKIFNPQYRSNNPVHATDMSKPFHFLIDIKTNRIMLATHNSELIRILSRIPNTFQVYNITVSQIPGCKDWKLNEHFDFEYPWNSKSLDVQFFINASELAVEPLTSDEIYYYFLIQQKAVLISVILAILESMRLDCNVSDNTYQESIYREKYEQALKVIENNIFHDYENEYYYVTDWASIKELDLVSAARDIKLNHDLLHHRLSKIEYARLMFIDKIRKEETLSNLPVILKEFRMFNFGYLKL
jgi:hypothetical protein